MKMRLDQMYVASVMEASVEGHLERQMHLRGSARMVKVPALEM